MNTKYSIIIALIAIAIILGSLAAYIYLSHSPQPPKSHTEWRRSNISLSPPNAMIKNYSANVNPNVQINYQSIGSGGGISACMPTPTVDFGASDAPLSATDMANIPNALHIPETIGAVTVAYNLPGVSSGSALNRQSHRRYLPRNNNNVE